MSVIKLTHRWLKPNSYIKACFHELTELDYLRKYNLSITEPYLLVETNFNFGQRYNTTVDLFSFIDTYCIELLQKSQAKFILDATMEGSNGLTPNFIELLEISAAKHQIPTNNIFYLTVDTAESMQQSSINIFYFNPQVDATLKRFTPTNITVPSKLFSCLNRKPRYWRSLLQYELLQTEYADQIAFSHPAVNSIKDFLDRPYDKYEEMTNQSMVSFFGDQQGKVFGNMFDPTGILTELYTSVAFDLTMLTVQDKREEIIDEKVFKPMLMKKPILIWGIQGINTRGLEQLGFKTYDDWFDLSFDNVADIKTRMRLLKHEVMRVCNHLVSLDVNSLQAWVNKNTTVLNHNYNLLHQFKANSDSIQRFIKTINA